MFLLGMLCGAIGVVCLVLLFALCLERFTRSYGETGGPPWERR